MIKLKDLLKENPADYVDKDADDVIKLLRRKQRYDQFDGVGATEAKGGTSIMKKWKDIPKRGEVSFGTYGMGKILSKDNNKVVMKIKGKKLTFYTQDYRSLMHRRGKNLADYPLFPFELVGIGESKND